MEIGVLAKQGRSQRAIAREMGVSRNTVKKILEAPREARKYGPRPPVDSKLEPFKTYLNERVAAAAPQWIPATVLHREITERGFEGVYETTKRYLRKLKAAKVVEPVVRFETEPGEQMQFDWATMRRGRDRLVVFIATMGWSRASYVRFATDETIETLIASLYGAFDYFGGVPKTALTDNMKVVVDQRDAYGPGLHRYNKVFLDFAGHCGFAPRLCQPYRAKTKGKVERFVRYLRESFYVPLSSRLAPAKLIVDATTANIEVMRWLDDVANARLHATTKAVPAMRLSEEHAHLLPLPPPWRGMIAAARPRKPTPPPAQVTMLQRPLSAYDALVSWSPS